ncbi:helix-turn-helix domain-containing protein, partial [Acinetobacter sp. ME22]|uniref:helix-turn-helix domain-containing protein n=1 Tax=Acinetobacter sp. ME22 TaxID=2904802 RepID=UPI001EDB2B8F
MLITMSDKEIQRLAVLQDVRDQRITQVRAAEILNLSTRQITRLLQKLKQDGVLGLTHASRGQPGHHRHDEAVKS